MTSPSSVSEISGVNDLASCGPCATGQALSSAALIFEPVEVGALVGAVLAVESREIPRR